MLRASTWTCSSRPRMATRPSAATRCIAAGSAGAGADRRAHRRRRGVAVSDPSSPPWRPTGAARTHRGLLHLDGRGAPASAAPGGRLGDRPARGHATSPGAARAGVPARLLYSSRTWDSPIYREELQRLSRDNRQLGVVHVLTRETPAGWTGPSRRVDAEMVRELAFAPADEPQVYVCGPRPCRVRGRASGRPGPRPWKHRDRALRPDRRTAMIQP